MSASLRPPLSKASLAAHLATLPQRHPSTRTKVSDLPRWVKLVIARKDIYGITWAEALDETAVNRAHSTLAKWIVTPAARTFRSEISNIIDDPIKMGALIIRSDIANAALDYLGAIEAAKAAGDYREVRMGLKDLLKTHNLIKDSDVRTAGGSMTINVTLSGGAALEPAVITSDYTILDADIVEDD